MIIIEQVGNNHEPKSLHPHRTPSRCSHHRDPGCGGCGGL